MRIPDHLICLLKNLYAGQETTVRTGCGTTDWFKIEKGVQQACILSSCLFNLYAEYVHVCVWLCNPMDCGQPSFSVHGILQVRYWSGLPSPPPLDLPHPGIEPESLMSPALAGGFFTTRTHLGSPICIVQFSHSVVTNSLWPYGLHHARLPCPSPTPEAYSNSCPLSLWTWYVMPYHVSDAIQPSHLLSSPLHPPSIFPSISLQKSQFFTSSGQCIAVSASASVLPMNIQDWSPSEWTGWISLQSKGLSRVFSNTTVQKHQFFGPQLSLQSNSHIHTGLLEEPKLWLDGPLLAK